MTISALPNQLVNNTLTALSGNTSPAANNIRMDALNVEIDISNNDLGALTLDTAALVNDANQAVSSHVLTSSQAGAIQLPAAEEQVGRLVANGLTTGASGNLAALFQKYAGNNNLPTDAAHLQASWNQFIGEISSSVPGFNVPGTQATLTAAYQQASQQAGISSPSAVTGPGAASSPAATAASLFQQDVVNGNPSTAAQFPAQYEQAYLAYCQQSNLNFDSYASYSRFNAAVQQDASATLGANSAAMVALKNWDNQSVFARVRAVLDAGGSSSG